MQRRKFGSGAGLHATPTGQCDVGTIPWGSNRSASQMTSGWFGTWVSLWFVYIKSERSRITTNVLFQTIHTRACAGINPITQTWLRGPDIFEFVCRGLPLPTLHLCSTKLSDSRGPRQVPSGNRGQTRRICGGPFRQGHQNTYPTKSTKCQNWWKTGHVARVCWSFK